MIAGSNVGGDQRPAFLSRFHYNGGIADAGHDAVTAHKVHLVRIRSAHKFSEQSALRHHLYGGIAMHTRINLVQPMCQYANGGQTVLQGSAMRLNVDAISQPTDDQYFEAQFAQFPKKTVTNILSILRAVAGAYDINDAALIQRHVTFEEKQDRGVRAFLQPLRIGRVMKAQAIHFLFHDKAQFFFGTGYLSVHVGYGLDQLFRRIRKHLF